MSERPDGTHPSSIPDMRLQAHLAEYDALTTRLTYWITIQYGIYAVGGAYLAFAIQLDKHVSLVSLVWASVFGLQLLGWAVLHTEGEIFTYVEYIEVVLKPRVQSLATGPDLWGFETFLARQRRKGFSWFEWNWAAPTLFVAGDLVAIFLIYLLIKKGVWTSGDTIWGLLNLFLSIIVGLKFRHNAATKARIRRSLL